jgi:hypothetical protein
MKKFMIFQRMDTANAYIKALLDDGYERVYEDPNADFFLYDSPGVGKRLEAKAGLMERMPGFIYPHNARSYPIFDGLYEALPASCNFVMGPLAKECMMRYGYKYRVESVGFPYFKIRPFVPSNKTRLLFVPIRPFAGYELYRASNDFALDFILGHREYFEQIKICKSEGQYDDLVTDGNVEVITTHPKESSAPIMDMVERIENSDIVISAASTAIIAMACGKGVVMYGQRVYDKPGRWTPVHMSLYQDIYSFPFELENMSVNDVLETARKRDCEIEHWVQGHLGGDFDAGKFLSIIGEYV